MADLVFPPNPETGQTYQGWVYDGEKWVGGGASVVVSGVPEAPSDGQSYARQAAAWRPIIEPQTIVTEAPQDGRTYGRCDTDWQLADTGLQGPVGPMGPPGPTGPPGTTTWAGITDRPVAFPPTPHQHQISDIAGLAEALAGKEPIVAPGDPAMFWRGDKIWAAPAASLSTAEYTFSTTAGLPPSTGQMRADGATQTAWRHIYLHYTNAVTVDIRNALKLIAAGNLILVQDKTNAVNVLNFEATGPAVDAGGYIAIPVMFTSGTAITAGRVIFAVFGLGTSTVAK